MNRGCLFWFVLVPIVFILVLAAGCSASPMGQAFQNETAARKAAAQAEKVRAEADKIYAQGYTDAMNELTAVAANAVRADTNAAHPLQYLLQTAVQVVLVAIAILVVALLIGLGVAAKNPDLIFPKNAQTAQARNLGTITCQAHHLTFSLKDWPECPLCMMSGSN